jgi:hypothetical protein
VNIHDELSDDEVLRATVDVLSARPVPEAPDPRAIMARGRARRRRWLAGIGLGGTAATAALAFGLASALAAGPPPALAAGTIRTAAFTLVKHAKGTVTLTLTHAQAFNPRELQQALAKDGIPALVKINIFCSSHPAPPPTGAIQLQLPDGAPAATSGPGPSPVPPDAVTVINPGAMPAGTELLFDYFAHGHGLITSLGYVHSYTCVSGFAPGG